MNAPLTDQDFAQIRSNVMREIARRQRRSSWLLAGAVAFAVLAMVFVLIPKNDAGRIAGATQKKPPARISVAPAILPATPVATAQVRPIKHHHHHRRTRPLVMAFAARQPMTIELHTANPDVRIIWIAK